jgi:hypothetical protein
MSLYSGNNYLTKVILVGILVVERRSKMKKLMVVAVIGMLLVGCGTDATLPEDTFFNDYFGDCVEMCQLDNTWLAQCKDNNPELQDQPIPDVTECVRVQWDCGQSNYACQSANLSIQKELAAHDCTEWTVRRHQGIPNNCWLILGDQ